MGSRHKARRQAVILLYRIEITSKDYKTIIKEYLQNTDMTDDEIEYCLMLIKGYMKNRIIIDKLISKKAEKWQLDRIAGYERNILRVGIYELLFKGEIPPKVAINEAINLAKELGSTDKSPAFINAIMDAIYGESVSDAK
ncbi:MAG: transcription antitermination factor NusB [Candidatus Coatesbacteria bacterium]|nr:MAG: transcription antitermination factor NusB [Candidatus Coatesbacteria bacterium]